MQQFGQGPAFDPTSITDLSGNSNAPWAKPFQTPPKAVIVHHTGGGGDATGVLNTLNHRNLGTQYVINRDGSIVQTLPDGYAGRQIINGSGVGAGLNNGNTVGIEVIAKNDSDVTPAQVEASKKLIPYLQSKYGMSPASVYGHGEVNPGHKEATEGLTIANSVRGQTPGSGQQASGATPTIGPDYYTRVAQIESGGNSNAVSKSGATGKYQFLPATLRQYGGSPGGDQEAPMRALTADNNAKLAASLGRPPTLGELYLAHQQGPWGAYRLIGNPDKTPAQLGLGKAVAANGGNPNAPASEFVKKWTAKLEGTSGAGGVSTPGTGSGGQTPSATPGPATGNPYLEAGAERVSPDGSGQSRTNPFASLVQGQGQTQQGEGRDASGRDEDPAAAIREGADREMERAQAIWRSIADNEMEKLRRGQLSPPRITDVSQLEGMEPGSLFMDSVGNVRVVGLPTRKAPQQESQDADA